MRAVRLLKFPFISELCGTYAFIFNFSLRRLENGTEKHVCEIRRMYIVSSMSDIYR